MKQVFNILDGERNKHADYLHRVLREYGIDFATGVPCGAQKHIIQNLMMDSNIFHVPATKEAEAIGIAAGAYLAGRNPLVYMQNSGLFDSSNDIASLLLLYRIPVFLLVTWRGCPGESAPQHFVTGKATKNLLESIGVPYGNLEKDNIDKVVSSLFENMQKERIPVALLIQRGWYK